MTFGIKSALRATLLNGGYTYWNDSIERTTGYCVGNHSTMLVIDTYVSTKYPSLVQPHDITNIKRWVEQHGVHADGIGFWLDINRLYVGATTHFPDSMLPSALQLAVTNKEISIYSIRSGDCIDVKPRDMNLALMAWSSAYCSVPAEGDVMLALVKTFLPYLYN